MKTPFTLSILVLMLLFQNVIAQKDSELIVEPIDLIKRANYAYQTSKLNEADSLYAKAMKFELDKEKSSEIAENYAQTLIKLGQFDSAYSIYTYGLMADSTNDYLWYLRGELTGKFLGNAASAAHDLTRAIELDPSRSIYYESRGLAFDAMRNYPAAERDYSKMIEIFGSARNYTSRALFYLRRGKLDQAMLDVQTAIIEDELYTWSYITKGEILLKKSEKDKACAAFRKANDMGNTSPNLMEFLEQCPEKIQEKRKN